MYYQPPSALDGSMGRRTSRRHYSLVKLQTASWKEPLAELLTRLITRRSHLNLLWTHIALSIPMIYTLCYGQYGESQSQLPESS